MKTPSNKQTLDKLTLPERQGTGAERAETRKAILSLVSAALFGKDENIPGGADWYAIYREVCRHGIVSLTFPVADSLGIPEDIRKMWSAERDRYIMTALKNIRCHFDVHKLLSAADIPYVILKGAASGSYYPDYMARAYGDVDFLVDENRYEEASEFLESRGFEYGGEHDFHKRFSKGSMTYELHKNVPGLPLNDTSAIIRDFLSDIMEASVPFRHCTDVCNIPCDRHHALVLLLHTANHMKSEGVGLRHLCDWAAFASNMSDEFFESEMQDILKRAGLWHFAKLLTATCSKYLGLRDFAFAKTDDPEYLGKFINEFFSSGNFGTKRSRENIAARRNTSYVAINKKNRLQFMIKVFNDSSAARFPVVRRKPFLKPAAWIYVGVRHIVRMISGERSLEFTKALVSDNAETREFVESWHLFEPEDS